MTMSGPLLPDPVRRYFRAALPGPRPGIDALTIEQRGTFNMSEDGERWKPFTAVQRITTEPRGFEWDARIRIAPAIFIRVRDAYVRGEGILEARLFGLLPLIKQRGTRELAEGELMRWFAEAPWYPTALLPDRAVTWEGLDESAAKGTLTEGVTTVALRFHFGADDLIDSVRAEARGRTVRGAVIPTPWEGRWWNYAERGGMRVPLEGEVAWIIDGRPKPYWRGRVLELRYGI